MKFQLMIDNRVARPIRDTWEEVVQDAVTLGVGHKIMNGVKLAAWAGASIKRIT